MICKSFDPIFAPEARVLIVGSMPSVKSLEAGFYYAHPRNAFWPFLSDIFHAPVNSTCEKRSLVENHSLALWDVAESCVRKGSLDSSMRDILPNDIPSLVRTLPIERILLNGQAATRLFHRFFPELEKEKLCISLPSTSPAHTMPYSQKLLRWTDALVYTASNPYL